MAHEGRNSLCGFPWEQDRLWEIDAGVGAHLYLSEYNDEITGYSSELHEAYPDVIHYGGNAYYVTGKHAEKYGWIVREIDDRRERAKAKEKK